MSVSIAEFWKLLVDSRLLTRDQCQQLSAEFSNIKGAAQQTNCKTLTQWLISRNALTAYQATILEAGRSGPFYYGDYKVYDRVDQGRLAGLFRAIHEPTSHPVLLKFVTGEAIKNPSKWAELVKQVRGQGAILHPNLSQCFEPVDVTNFKFVAIEDLRGEALDSRLSRGGLRPSDACRAARLVAQALAPIHQAGQTHADLRPHNLWLESTGNIKLFRDPLFRPEALHVAQSDASSELLIRADYMAPELNQVARVADPLSDIYALGCTLYHLLTGRPPFAGGDVTQKMSRHASEAIQPLEQFGVPPQIGQLVAYMMAKNPDIRYQQASVIADQLAQFVDPGQLNVQPPVPLRTLPAYENWVKQKQATLASRSVAQPAFPGVREIASPAAGAAAGFQINTAAPTKVASSKATPFGATPVAKAVVAEKGDGGSMASRFSAKKKSKKNMVIAASSIAGALAIVIVVLIAFASSGGGDNGDSVADGGDGEQDKSTDVAQTSHVTDPEAGDKDKEKDKVANGGESETVVESGFKQTIEKSDELPWASPTTGPPISFTFVPPMAEIFLIARLADIVENPEGEKALKALGPAFDNLRQTFERDSGFRLNQIEQVIIGLHENDGNVLRPSFVVRLRDTASESDLLGKWGKPSVVPVPESETNYYKGTTWSFYLPPREPGAAVNLFVMGATEDIAETAKTGAAEPLMRKELRQLIEWSNNDRHFTVLFTPNAVFNDQGQKLFTGEFAKVIDPLDELIGDGVMAAMASLHFGQQFYAELRIKGELGKLPINLAEEFRDRLKQVPNKIDAYIATLGADSHWAMVRTKFPGMIRYLQNYLRIGVEDGQALVNCYINESAGHSIILAAEYAIASKPGASSVGPTVVAAKPAPKSIEELLNERLDVIDIPQQDLINAVVDIKDGIRENWRSLPFEFDIRLLGNDLGDEGITQNQPVRNFKMEGKTISEILTGLVMTANPVTTVKDPSETDQKLIWVVGPDPDSGKKIILITTRKAATAKSYELPKPFQQAG